MRVLKTLAIILALGGCQSAPATQIAAEGAGSELVKLGPPRQSDDIMAGGRYREPWLSAAIKDAARQPLGSAGNPVRADMPGGERAYLARLRCPDGQAPAFERSGNLGFGAFGSIVDAYEVRCAGDAPVQSTIIMDMYFPGYVETLPVPGFTIRP